MRLIDRLRSRFRTFVHREERDREMDDEVRFHLDMETEQNRRLGLDPEEARRQAQVRFGGVEGVKEACRDACGIRLFQDLAQDVGYALRSLRRSPGFSTVVVLTLALGIGANTAMFTVVNTVLLRPLPYREGALAWTIPLNSAFHQHDGTFQIEGRPLQRDQGLPRAESRGAGPAYFEALGVALIRGRGFVEQDRGEAPLAAVVSQSLARRHFGDADPVGRRISFDGETWGTIVGVAGDVRNIALDQEPKDTIYLPFARFPGVSCHYFIRTFADPHTVARQFQQAVHSLDPDVALHDVKTLEEVRERALSSPRLTTILLGAFAGLALAITAAGLSGLIAYSVSQRTHEIGIRMALGAEPRRVLGMVLHQGMRSVALGLGIGALAALALARLVSGLLFGVAPTDALCFVGSGLLLVLVATLACLLPARRATAIDPQIALRSL